jgi:hypothetical protein
MILRVGLVQTRTPATDAEALAHVAMVARSECSDQKDPIPSGSSNSLATSPSA